MKYVKLGNSELTPSVVGLGGLHFGVFCDQAETTNIIHAAIDQGINFIDTAPIYGHGRSEELIKNAIKGKRNKVILSTKVGLKPTSAPDGSFGVEVEPLTAANVRKSVEKSLINLVTDHIDLYQLHAYDPLTPLAETFGVLSDLVKEGKILHLGCSNYDHREFLQVWQQFPSFISFQVHYNVIERRAEQEILPTCQEYNVGLICNRALARGVLTGKYRPDAPLPANSRAATSARIRNSFSKTTLSLVAALTEFAQKNGRTATQLAIAWLLSKPEVAITLVGVRDREQLSECVKATDWKLRDPDLSEIKEVIKACGQEAEVKARPATFFEK